MSGTGDTGEQLQVRGSKLAAAELTTAIAQARAVPLFKEGDRLGDEVRVCVDVCGWGGVGEGEGVVVGAIVW